MGINNGCDLFIDVKDIPAASPTNDQQYAKNSNVVNFQQLANAIAAAISGETGTPVLEKFIGTTVQANPLINAATPASKTRKYLGALFVCRKEVCITVKNNNVQIASVRLGPANPTEMITFLPTEQVIAAQNIKVEFTKAFTTNNVDIEIYLRGVEENA